MSITEEYNHTYPNHPALMTQQQPLQNDAPSFADHDAFNHFSYPWPHHKAAAEIKQTQGSWLPALQLQDLMARLPASPLRITLRYLHFLPLPEHRGQHRTRCAPPLAPDSCFPQASPHPPTWTAGHPALCTGHLHTFPGHALLLQTHLQRLLLPNVQ